MDISRAKELLKGNLLTVHENSDHYTERDAQHLERIMNLLTQVRKLREQEVSLIFSDCEELYLTKKFELADELLGFAETIVERSGLYNWQPKIQVLQRKIRRSREIVEKLRKYYISTPGAYPILQIQQNFENLELLFQDVQGDNTRQDAIHPDIITEFEAIIKNLESYMQEHGIPKLTALDKKSGTVWASTITSIDLKSKEAKLKRLIHAADKAENYQEAQAEILKAYKLIQENPYFFSLQQKQEIIALLEKYGQQFEAASEIQIEILRELDSLLMALQFDRALMKLHQHREIHGKVLNTEELDDLERTHEKITLNQEIFLKLQAVETQLDLNDVLGAKTAFIQFNHFFNTLSRSVIVISPLENRIALLLTALGEPKLEDLETPNLPASFDPFGDEIDANEEPTTDDHYTLFTQILDTKGQISKQNLATILKISDDELFTELMSWKRRYDFEVVGSEIFSKLTLASPSTNSSPASDRSSSSESSDTAKNSDHPLTENSNTAKDKPSDDEEDILDTLDDLLNTDL